MAWFLGILLLTADPAWAQRALERVCFSSAEEAARAIPILDTVLVKGQDEIKPDGACLDVLVAESRGELFLRWTRTRLPNARLAFSTTEAPRPTCEMVVTKTRGRELTEQGVQAGPHRISVVQSEGSTASQEQSFLKVLSGGTAKLGVDGGEMEVTCTARGGSNYLLRFQLRPTAPIVPVTAPGTVVAVQAVPPPEASSLSTEVEATAGVNVNLGQIIKDLSGSRHAVAVPSGVDASRSTGEESVKWSLMIK